MSEQALRGGVTVIVRTIGRPTLAAALDSVWAQPRDDVEVLVVDAAGSGLPASALPSGRAAPATPAEPPAQRRLRVVSLGRALHRTEAAQAGLDAAATRHALFLDDDDVLLDGHLDKLLNALAAAPDAVLAYTGVEIVALGTDGAAPEPRGAFDQPFAPWELLLGNRLPIHAALFDVARVRAGGAAFDRGLDVYEDWDFWLQVALLGRFVHVPGISARYHVHAGASQVNRLRHGDAPFWQVWRKWWPRAPEAWWSEALHQREVATALRGGLEAARIRHGDLEASVQDRERRWHEAVEQWQLTIGNLHRTEAMLRERDEALAREQGYVAERDRAIAERDRGIAERDRSIAERDRTIAERDRRLADALAREQRLERSVAEATQLAAQLRLLHGAADLQRRRQADELLRLEASPSWRLTAPLRHAEGKARALRRRAGEWRRRLGWTPGTAEYRRWIDEVEAPLLAERHAAVAPLLGAARPHIAVLMPVFEPNRAWLDEAIESLVAQSWPHWSLCIADDGSAQRGLAEHLARWCEREPRVRVTRLATNRGIAAATNAAFALALDRDRADWVALLDQDDRLAPQALAEIALAAHADAAAELIYSDEDKLDVRGRRGEPHFKPGFSVERLRGQNYLNHFVALKRERLESLGGWREGFDGAQDHELLLRATEALSPAQVHHVSQVLYHWRAAAGSTAASSAAKARALQASLAAVNASLARVAPGAQAEGLPLRHWLRVRYPVVPPRPSVQGWDEHAGDEAPFVGDGPPFVLVLGRGVERPDAASFDELLSLATRPGVALVGGVTTDAAGGWLDAMRDGPEAPPIGAAFGRREMVQDAAVLPAGLLLMSRAVHDAWRAQGLDARPPDAAAMAAFCDGVRRARSAACCGRRSRPLESGVS